MHRVNIHSTGGPTGLDNRLNMFTRCSRLFNRLWNRWSNRLYVGWMLVASEMEPGHGSLGHRVTVSAILTRSGRVTGQCVRSVF